MSRARVRSQLGLLLGLWWRHMRRRPRRLGDLPKQSGVPTFLLINLLSLGYLMPLAFSTVKASVAVDLAGFAWHALGIALTGFGAACASSSFAPQGRSRNDAFLEALPISLAARIVLALMDGYVWLLLSLIIPWAALSGAGARGWHAPFAVLFGAVLYLSLFVAGQATRAWLRVFGPPATARFTGYFGTGLSMAGLGLMFFSLGPVIGTGPITRTIAEAWLSEATPLSLLYGCAALLVAVSYLALWGAERAGFDRLDVVGGAPRARKGTRSRRALEGLMVWRQGGRALLVTFSILLIVTIVSLELHGSARANEPVLLIGMGMMIYLGAIQVIALAGRSARSDLVARPFLAALPLAPHQVLEGKAQVLRKLVIPVFIALLALAIMALRAQLFGLALRAMLGVLALYIAVAGAVAIAFMATGVGVAGVAGGQAGSSFSTQLLLMPLLATVFARDGWAASVALIAVVAVAREAQRAAQLSIRWLDDPDDQAERETSVWRALLAATAFFATQALSARLLAVFRLPTGYALAIGFAFASAMLVLLTVRSSERFARPRLLPRAPWYLPVGLLAGGASGQLALWMTSLFPLHEADAGATFSAHEAIALAITTVLVAPLAEEYFFRGWLQQAIAHDLPAPSKRWAFALGALAFALAHVGTYGLPQLVLGLIAGALYAAGGGLVPGMLAHAAHNAVVLASMLTD